ncbi:MAG: hypothetical protein IPG79_03450 [Saprospiraceae bacterium]|nr:hypothetical protein [Saprospiraceae bacterium]
MRQKPDILSKLVGTIENGAIVVTDDFDKFNDLQKRVCGANGFQLNTIRLKVLYFQLIWVLNTCYFMKGRIQYYPKVKELSIAFSTIP